MAYKNVSAQWREVQMDIAARDIAFGLALVGALAAGWQCGVHLRRDMIQSELRDAGLWNERDHA